VSDRCLAAFSLFQETFQPDDQFTVHLSDERKQNVAKEMEAIRKPPEKVVDLVVEDKPKEFRFIPVSSQDLVSEIRDLTSPFLLTQIRFGLRPFSDQKIRGLLEYYIEKGRLNEVFLILKCAVKQNLDLGGLDLSELGLGELVELLKEKVDRKIFLRCQNASEVIDVLKFGERIRSFQGLIHVKKKDLRKVLSIFPSIDSPNMSDSIAICLTCLHTADLNFVVPLLGSVLNRLPEMPRHLLSSVLGLFNHKLIELPLESASILLLRIVSRFHTTAHLTDLVKRVVETETSGHPRSRLVEALVVAEADVDALHPTLSYLLNSFVPSLFRCGLQLLGRVLNEQSPEICLDLLQTHFSTIIDKFPLFGLIQPIVHLVPQVLIPVVSSAEFQRPRNHLLRSIESFMWGLESPNFVEFERVFVAILENIDPSSAVWKQVCQITGNLHTIPGLFHVLVSCVTVRLEREDDPATQSSLIIDHLLKWCMICGQNDCYALSDRLYEWAVVMMTYCGIEDTMSHFCFTIPRYFPRFSPYFRALLRFVEENQNHSIIESSLENASLIQKIPTQEEAFRIAARTKNYKQALELVIHEDFCEAHERSNV
jgi:hypothetical protein